MVKETNVKKIIEKHLGAMYADLVKECPDVMRSVSIEIDPTRANAVVNRYVRDSEGELVLIDKDVATVENEFTFNTFDWLSE